jgi:hypothetical protein
MVQFEQMTFEEGLYHAVAGDATLFVGAGFSAGASSIGSLDIPTAGKLAKLISAAVEVDEDDLEEAADVYLSIRTPAELCEFLVPLFSCAHVARHHEQICSVPWRRVYSTNYDDVVEQAAKSSSRHIHATCLSDDPQDIHAKAAICLHINGSITRLNEDTLSSEFKLGTRSNLTSSFRDSPWATLFLSDFRNSRAIFFVGYSLKYDLDLKRLMIVTPGLREKTFFVTLPEEPEHNRRRMEEFGTVVSIGVEAFGSAMEKKLSSFDPPTEVVTTYESFSHMQTKHSEIRPVRDEDVFALLVKGQLDFGILRSSVHEPDIPRYAIHRTVHDEVLDEITKLGRRTVVIHADLGNGKTVLVQQLKIDFSAQGFEVFEFDEFGESWEDEVEKICALATDTVVVIEGYADKSRLLEQLSLHKHGRVVLILTERSVVSDATTITLPDPPEEIAVFEINYLATSDIDLLVRYFNHYGLWGKHHRKSILSKKAILENDCHQNLQTILLSVVFSSDIEDRFAVLFNTIHTGDRRLLRPMLLAIISRALNIPLRVEHIAALTDFSDFNTAKFRQDASVREIFDFDGNEVRVKSPVLALSLLRRLKKLKLVFTMLGDICVRADNYAKREPYRQLLKRLNSFSELRHALPERTDFCTEIVNYYERIKTLSFYNRNFHFWLQYAIARLHYRQFDIAQRYFDNAYSLAQGNPVGTSFVDNHYARFLLESQIDNPEENNPIVSFEEAHKLLIRGSQHQRSWDYIFKVATNYLPFYNAFFRRLNDSDRRRFLEACKEMKHNVDAFKKRAGRYQLYSRHNVYSCERAINRIIAEEKTAAT